MMTRRLVVLIYCYLLAKKSAALRRRCVCPPNIGYIIGKTRGGGDGSQDFGYSRKNVGVIEFNPEYENPQSPTDESHTEWLQRQSQMEQQRQFQSQYQPQVSPPPFNSFSNQAQESSLLQRIRKYFFGLHHFSPSLFWTTISCLLVFGAWNIPNQLFPKRRHQRQLQGILFTWFVNSRENLRSTFGLSLFLSALSHTTFFHILANLFTLYHFGPRVAQLLRQQRFYRQHQFSSMFKNMAPLLITSAMASNTLFLIGRPKGSSLGLSGVTMSLLSIQARALPDQVFRFLFMGIIPISLRAGDMLQILLVLSFGGAVFQPGSRIAHFVHLGGLLYGIFYYDLLLHLFSPTRRPTLMKWNIRSLLTKKRS